MAPGARIVYYGALSSTDTDMDAALNWVVDHHAAQIISNSYGDSRRGRRTADLVSAESAIFIQAAIEGIGLYFSSGDDGDEIANLGYRHGRLAVLEPLGHRRGRHVSGRRRRQQLRLRDRLGHDQEHARSTAPGRLLCPATSSTAAAAARASSSGEPWYQFRVVPSAISHYFSSTTPGRAVPDVAMDGDPTTGMLVGETQTFSDGVYYDTYRIGGTSVSCPLFAGLMALADQRARHAHGFANPLLYALAGTRAYRDIVDPTWPPWPLCAATSTTARTQPTASRSRCAP